MFRTAFETGRASLYLRTRGAPESVWFLAGSVRSLTEQLSEQLVRLIVT
jgi:hypothetical protein